MTFYIINLQQEKYTILLTICLYLFTYSVSLFRSCQFVSIKNVVSCIRGHTPIVDTVWSCVLQPISASNISGIKARVVMSLSLLL